MHIQNMFLMPCLDTVSILFFHLFILTKTNLLTLIAQCNSRLVFPWQKHEKARNLDIRLFKADRCKSLLQQKMSTRWHIKFSVQCYVDC